MTTNSKTKPFYPPDWWTIAYALKQAQHWTCQDCGIIQGEDPYNNITVHHRDHDTFNNDPSNLRVLCQKCHLRHEGIYRRHTNYHNELNRKLKAGQRLLPGFAAPLFQQPNTAHSMPPATGQEPGIEH